MLNRPQINREVPLALPARLGMRALAIACAAAALLFAALALGAFPALRAQEDAPCQVTDLGVLGAETDSVLEATGRWTTKDCDSRFRTDSDAHNYRFELAEGGRVRIGLASADGDSYLYLLAEDGTRIADNDDGGAGLDARVERDLVPGVYLVEATTVGGRWRGPAGFSLTVSRVAGCEPVHLGSLEQGADLTATGSWSLDTCGSGFVPEHPAHRYLFVLSQGGRVRIDLKSENGDPVLSLISLSAGVIGANDDGGEQRNSRIERFLQPGAYLIEATTYLERDYQPLAADFTLVVQFVDEEEEQQSFRLKIEDTHTPDTVIAGEPFNVNYRVGNLGGGDLAGIDGTAQIYVVGPRVFETVGLVPASAGLWQAGVSYHSGPQVATAASVSIDEAPPFEVTFRSSGTTWIFVGVVTYDADGQEVGFHGLWHNLVVLSTFAFDTVTVEVDDSDYEVSAEADDEGMVSVSVTAVHDPDGDVATSTRARAVYAAGVKTQMLDGLFQRPAISGLPTTGTQQAVTVEDPSSDTLLEAFAEQYADAVSASRLATTLAAGEALSPVKLEDMLLGVARTASARYASLAASWTALQQQAQGDDALSVEQAFAFQSQLAYAERVLSPVVAAGETVRAARDAALGWDAPAVQDMTGELEEAVSCRAGASALRRALGKTDVENAGDLLQLDAEARVALPVYGLAVDAVLCAAADADGDSSRFLRTLDIADDREVMRLFGQEPPPPPPAPVTPPIRFRVIAKLADDGRIEYGVELPDREQVLPSVRFLAPDVPVDQWRVSSDVLLDDSPIGKIRTRRLADGRVEMGFRTSAGEPVTPDIRYLPSDTATGVWLRSSQIEVPPAATLAE